MRSESTDADIPVTASASYNIGDKVKFTNGSTDVMALGLTDKTNTGQAMTFTIVGKPNGTTITVYPKPIAADDAGLSTLQKAYANIDTQILNTAVVNRLNTTANKKVNLFWDRSAVEVIGGKIPAQLFKQFEGMKVVESTMSNGLSMCMLYSGRIDKLDFRFRIFTWYGVTVANPSNCGVALSS